MMNKEGLRNYFKKNKRGWVRIFEAVIAVLLIASVLLIVIGRGGIENDEDYLQIYKEEISILREVQLDDSLRGDVLDVETLPLRWEDFEENGLTQVKETIILHTPNYLDCKAMVCEIDSICILDEDSQEVYVQSVAITASLEKYSPRQLKLFCEKI